jgi:hypothetical protein
MGPIGAALLGVGVVINPTPVGSLERLRQPCADKVSFHDALLWGGRGEVL